MYFRATVFGVTNNLQRRNFYAILHFNHSVDGLTLVELHEMLFAVATNGQLQPLRQRIDTGNTNTMQATRYLIAVLVELTAGMQDTHHDFSR